MPDDELNEYKGRRFLVGAQGDGAVWRGHYRLLGIGSQQARQAAEDGRHQWTPIDPGWATRAEAERNAIQAAHAAIDALSPLAQMPLA